MVATMTRWSIISVAMILHHHHHSSLQNNLWCGNAQPLKFSLKQASLHVPPWRGSLRQVGFISAAAATTYRPINGITLISGIDRGGWGRGPHNRRWHSFGVGGILLVQLLFFFIRVTEDDDLAITERDKDVTVEVTEESFGELLIPCGVKVETFLI
jgi:hypothetical protein